MKKMLSLMFFICLTGCACSRKSKIELYRKALSDTNASLTQARDENVALHRVVERQHQMIVALKKKRK